MTRNRLQSRLNRPRHQRARSRVACEVDTRSRQEMDLARRQRARKSEGPSLEALAGAAVAGPFGYLAIEGIMRDNRHPIHWVVAGVIGVAGYAFGAGLYRWKQLH